MKYQERFESLDAWRGICALVVALYHYVYAFPSELREVGFVHNAYLFVDFFFVLSGFVIFYAYRDRIDTNVALSTFVIRRFGRVWPMHMAVLVGFAILLIIAAALPHPSNLNASWNQGEYSVRGFFLQMGLLNAMGLHQMTTWNGPAWSIGAEFYTYMVFACAVLVVRRWLVIVSIGLSFLALTIIFWQAPVYMNSTWDYGLIRCIAGFFVGGIAYHIHERCRDVPLRYATIAEITSLVIVILFVIYAGRSPDDVSVYSVTAPIVFAAAILIFARELGFVSLIVKLAPFRAVGRHSYSIYMTHKFVLVLIVYLAWLTGTQNNAVPPQEELGMFLSWPPTVLPFAFIGIILLISAASYRFIEMPGRNYFNLAAARYLPAARS